MKKLTPVFIISVIIAAVFIVWGVIPESTLGSAALTPVTSAIHSFIIEKFGWYYLLAATLFLVFTLYLIFSKYGNIKLGKPAEKPQYGYVSWFAMLFSAGMGIGLVFWGVSEPINHFHTPSSGEGGTAESARAALRYSFFHWVYILGLFIPFLHWPLHIFNLEKVTRSSSAIFYVHY